MSPHRSPRVAPDTPWTETGGFSPPPPVRSGGSLPPWEEGGVDSRGADHPGNGSSSVVSETIDVDEPDTESLSSQANTPSTEHGRSHPAFHPGLSKGTRDHYRRLFEKVRGSGPVESLTAAEKAEKAACMARHPAGKGVKKTPVATVAEYTVKSGDTLWDIAEEILESDDPRQIARYWPRVHRANRAVLGADPNILIPGQVLRLPTVGKESA